MGVSVWIEKLDGTRYPGWSGGLAGEKALWHYTDQMPGVEAQAGEPEDTLHVWRPTDFELFRRHPWYEGNDLHWQRMADILESHPDYWLYFSA